MKIFIKFLLFVFLNSVLFCQIPAPEILINNIKERIYQPIDYKNIYFDLDKKSIIQTKSEDNLNTREEFVGYIDTVYEGSFLHPNAKEYMLHLIWNYCDFFPHVGNFGPLNQFIIFDSGYNQISKIYFQVATVKFKEIVDIEGNGLNEIIMESYYCGMGICEYSTNIDSKDFENPILSYPSKNEFYPLDSIGYKEEPVISGNSYYYFEKGKFIVHMTNYDFIILNKSDIRKKNEESCERIYFFKDGKFSLISGKDCDVILEKSYDDFVK